MTDLTERQIMDWLYRYFGNSESVPSMAKKILCDSLAWSKFNFCDMVYGPCVDTIAAATIQNV